jgi:hypothetical protein
MLARARRRKWGISLANRLMVLQDCELLVDLARPPVEDLARSPSVKGKPAEKLPRRAAHPAAAASGAVLRSATRRCWWFRCCRCPSDSSSRASPSTSVSHRSWRTGPARNSRPGLNLRARSCRTATVGRGRLFSPLAAGWITARVEACPTRWLWRVCWSASWLL